MSKRHIETIAIQAGRNFDRQTGAVMPPIHLTTTFIRDNEGDFVYSRSGNPTRQALADAEQKVKVLMEQNDEVSVTDFEVGEE